MRSKSEVFEAEEDLFKTIFGVILGISIINLNLFENIIVLLKFIIAMFVALDFYYMWYRYYNDFPSKSFKWIFIHMFSLVVVYNLFLYVDDPLKFSILLSLYWVVDLMWVLKTIYEYWKEMNIKTRQLFLYYAFTDVILATIFLLMVFYLPFDYDVIKIILIAIYLAVRITDETLIAKIFQYNTNTAKTIK